MLEHDDDLTQRCCLLAQVQAWPETGSRLLAATLNDELDAFLLLPQSQTLTHSKKDYIVTSDAASLRLLISTAKTRGK